MTPGEEGVIASVLMIRATQPPWYQVAALRLPRQLSCLSTFASANCRTCPRLDEAGDRAQVLRPGALQRSEAPDARRLLQRVLSDLVPNLTSRGEGRVQPTPLRE
jgi:hypothetical protein